MAPSLRRSGPGTGALLAALLLLALTPGAFGRLMAVDFGSENIRVSLVNSNRRPIQVEVVNNEISKRKTSAVVGFVNGERLLGEPAAAVDGRYRSTIITRARDLLGKSAEDPSVTSMLQSNYLPYNISNDPNTSSIRIGMGPEESYSAEELVASILHYAHKISQEQFGGTFQDCVIVIPPFLGMQQRQALLDAAAIAGLNVISLIHAHSGAALQYGIERDFSNNTELVIFYDMGAGSVDVSLAKFTSVNKAKKFQQFEVLDVAWDNTLGGSSLDLILMEHFAAEFEEKHKMDIRGHPKVMSKLRKSVKKTKEMLSANKAAPIYAEELHEGIDFSSSITREKFEELAADFFERSAKPLLTVLERNGLKPTDVTNIELMGGGVRVPKLQEALQEALDGQTLSRHFTDPDEAVVLGSGLFAANFSNSFRLRPFGMVDCSPYGLSLDVATEGKVLVEKEAKEEEVDGSTAAAEAEEPEGDKEDTPTTRKINLLPFRKKLPIKRSVKLGRLAGDTANLTLSYNASEGLPPGVSDPVLGTYLISGISESLKKYNKTGKVTVYFAVGPSGMVTIEKAETVFDIVEYIEVEVPVKEEPKNETNSTEAGNATQAEGEVPKEEAAKAATEDGEGDSGKAAAAEEGAEKDSDGEEAAKESEEKDGEEGEEGEAAKGDKKKKKNIKKKKAEKPKMEKVKKQKKRTIHLPLKVAGGLSFGFKEEQLKASKARMKAIADADELKRVTEAAKNDLESFIISLGSLLYDEAIEAASTEEARDKLRAEAERLEDWLYDEGEEEEASTYKEKLSELRAMMDPIAFRAKEMEARPEAVDAATAKLLEMSKVGTSSMAATR